MDVLPTLTHAAALIVTAVAAVLDHRSGKIPNWLTLPLIGVGPAIWGVANGFNGMLMSIVGIGFCGLAPLIAYRMGGMAGGDVKLFAGIGGLVGPIAGIEAEFYAMVVASIASIVVLAWHGKLLGTFSNMFFVVFRKALPERWRRDAKPELRHKLRIGPFIFAGTAVAMVLRHPEWIGMAP